MASGGTSSASLTRRLLGRVAAGLLSVLFVAFVTFMADELAPGDAAMAILGEKARPEQITAMREQMGLDRPVAVRFVEYVGNAARGDFGNSYFGTREPVSELIGRSLPITAMLAVLAIGVAALIGILLGSLAAIFEDRWPDRIILALSTLGVTVPNFVLIPIFMLIFVLRMDLFPLTWETPLRGPLFFYLVLPVAVLAARPMAVLTRLTRASFVDVLRQEYMRFARAKGVPFGQRMFKHGLRNAMPPVVTAMGNSFGILLTGSFITETAFAMPGLGKAAIDAIKKRDTPVVMATALTAAVLYILVNLIVDLMQPALDPRVRESQV